MMSLQKIPTTLVFLPLYIIILLIAEWCLQAWSPNRPEPNVVPNPLFHHAYRPNNTFVTFPSKGEEFPPAINIINGVGMRGPLPTTKQQTRILLLGDSFVQADEVKFEETFGQLLNKHFKHKIEFISHGMVSWSPTPEFSWLHHYGFSLQPDHIVLFLCVNDFFRPEVFHQTDATYRKQAIYQDGVPIAYNLPKPTWSDWILMHSAIARLTGRLYHKLKPISGEIPHNVADEIIILSQKNTLWPHITKMNVTETLAVIEAIHKASINYGATLHVTLVPLPFFWPDEAVHGKALHPYNWPKHFTVSQSGIEEYIHKRLNELGVSWIDLQTTFARTKKTSRTKLYNEVDGHWNTNGHQVVFKFLVNYFQQNIK
jgi:hypothetical protein